MNCVSKNPYSDLTGYLDQLSRRGVFAMRENKKNKQGKGTNAQD